jgi:hypothetical protein
MRYASVYLRDPAEADRMQQRIEREWKDIPLVMVRGAVCRPEWLIEIEGLAGVTHDSGEGFSPYL